MSFQPANTTKQMQGDAAWTTRKKKKDEKRPYLCVIRLMTRILFIRLEQSTLMLTL